MSQPLVNDCLLLAAQLLSDPAQTVFDNTSLWPFFSVAYTELWSLLVNWDLQTAQTEMTYTLPAGNTSVTPAVVGIQNMGEPWKIWERSAGSSDNYTELQSSSELPQALPSVALQWVRWRGDKFEFVGALGNRDLKFEFFASENVPPVGGTVLIDGSKNFLGNRTAALMMISRGMPQAGQQFTAICFGRSMEPDGTGGLLRQLVNPMLKEKQKRPARPQAYRWHTTKI